MLVSEGGSRYQPAGDGPAAGAGYSDPFTGSGAYRPGQSSAAPASEASDPFTGEQQYRADCDWN